MSESVPTKTYYIWVFAAKDDFAESLVAKMVRRGFTIGPLGRQLVLEREDNPSFAIAMSVYRIPRNDEERKEYNALGLHGEVSDVMKVIKGKYFGIVVSAAADATWNVGNVSIKAEMKEVVLEKAKVN